MSEKRPGAGDFYQEDNHTIFTSAYLRRRNYCCKSACLHCPYGFTLQKLGLQFQLARPEDEALIEASFKARPEEKKVSSLAASLLGNSMGKVQKVDLATIDRTGIHTIWLKGRAVGWMTVKGTGVDVLALLPQFQNQGLGKDEIFDQFQRGLSA